MQSVSVDVAAAVASAGGANDERESLYNGRPQGPANRISVPVEQVAAINGFMIDVDLAILNPAVSTERLMTPPIRFGPRENTLEALRRLRSARARLGVVVDEGNGRPRGVVAIKDLVEPITGQLAGS